MIERQYPVIIHRFSQRHGSGGAGRNRGGDGCIRDIEFTREVSMAILSQRRAVAPYGMAGGHDGAKAMDFWKKGLPDGSYKLISLGGNNQCTMKKGDHMILREFVAHV
jgi:5-oxoprolinase (ATP-hydrolysing)